MRQTSSELAGRVAGYIFVLATMGLAVVFYYGYASFFELGAACPLCITMYVSVAGIFLVSAAAATSLTPIPARLGEDLSRADEESARDDDDRRVGGGVDCVARAVSASGGVRAPADRSDGRRGPEPPLETLTPEQIAEWDKYLDVADAGRRSRVCCQRVRRRCCSSSSTTISARRADRHGRCTAASSRSTKRNIRASSCSRRGICRSSRSAGCSSTT